ncbi:hypothetical protein [Nannocystis pusilla]|uniref:hypothetical protein n=1 Tax=Nannocystis pusilla TaxID=889268 RepID=UPI003BF3E035
MQRPLISITAAAALLDAHVSTTSRSAELRLVSSRRAIAAPRNRQLEKLLAPYKEQLGRAAMAAWALEVQAILEDSRGTALDESVAVRMRTRWAHFVEYYSWHGLQRELRDEGARTQASGSNAALIAFLDRWMRRIEVMQQKYPLRWHVADLAPDEVRDDLREKILTAFLKDGFEDVEKPAREATFMLIARQRDHLRGRRRIRLVSGPPLEKHRDPVPSPEQLIIEMDHVLELQRRLDEAPLSRTQRAWVESFSQAVEQSELDGRERTSFADVARIRGTTRAAVTRMSQRLQHALGGCLDLPD